MHIKLLLIILLLGALAGWNCTGRGSIEQNCDERLLTSFIASKKDSMLNHPGKLIQTYQKLRENTTDSLTSYALLHAISQCYWWGGHRDSATATTLRVINCCEQATSTPCLQRLLANVYYTHANRFANIAEYDTAMIYYEKALDAASKSGVVDNQPRIYFSIAANFERKSDYTNATYYYRKALFVADSAQVEAPYFVINLSLAKLYGEIDNREMAEFYFRQLEKDLNSVPKELKALYYNFRGVFHTNIKEWTKALEYHRLYNYFVQSGESPSYSYPYQRAASTANLGEMFLKMNNTDSARYWLQQASDWYRQSIEQGMEIPTIGYFIDGLSAMLALQENRVNDAGKLLAKQALYDSTAVNPFMIYEHHKLLEEFHAWKGDYRDAYNYRLKVEAYNDSLRSTQIRNNIAETEMRYRQDTILLRKDLHIAVAEGRASRWESIALLGGLLALLLAVFGIYAYHSYRQKRSINAELEIKNREITEQRDHIVRQNREITNSILYARRIQNAVLPERQMLKDDIDMFIFYRPRNIVSGDFYWMSKHENRLVIIAADCTGHGVPGAFMSMLGIAFLNEIVGRHHTIYANEILNRLRENVITSLGQTGKSIEIESKDGMDIAVCIIDIASMTLQYAGAYNPLVLIRNGELQVIKADKMPVAYSDHGQQTFTNNHISLVAGDAVYIFSDGYADQFGGEHEKKYSSRRLKKSLLEVHQLPVSEQEQIMAQKYDEWKGAHEQVDDVLLMGMRV